MKKIFLIFLFLFLLINFVNSTTYYRYSTNISVTNDITDSVDRGIKILIGNESITLYNLTMFSGSTATKLQIANGTTSTKVILKTCDFSGITTYCNYTFLPNNYYHLFPYKDGATHKQYYKPNNPIHILPKYDTYFTITNVSFYTPNINLDNTFWWFIDNMYLEIPDVEISPEIFYYNISIKNISYEVSQNSSFFSWYYTGNYSYSYLFNNNVLIYNGTELNYTLINLNNNTNYNINISVYYNETIFSMVNFSIFTNQTEQYIPLDSDKLNEILDLSRKNDEAINMIWFFILFIVAVLLPFILEISIIGNDKKHLIVFGIGISVFIFVILFYLTARENYFNLVDSLKNFFSIVFLFFIVIYSLWISEKN